MELLDNVSHMDSLFGLFGDSVCFYVTLVHGFHQMNSRLRNQTHPMVLLGEEAQIEAQFSSFRDSANLDAR